MIIKLTTEKLEGKLVKKLVTVKTLFKKKGPNLLVFLLFFGDICGILLLI